MKTTTIPQPPKIQVLGWKIIGGGHYECTVVLIQNTGIRFLRKVNVEFFCSRTYGISLITMFSINKFTTKMTALGELISSQAKPPHYSEIEIEIIYKMMRREIERTFIAYVNDTITY